MKEGQEVRRVAQLDWRIIEESYEKPFVASGLQFVPLPVNSPIFLNYDMLIYNFSCVSMFLILVF